MSQSEACLIFEEVEECYKNAKWRQAEGGRTHMEGGFENSLCAEPVSVIVININDLSANIKSICQ